MKRPDGFDRPPAPPAATQRTSRKKDARAGTTRSSGTPTTTGPTEAATRTTARPTDQPESSPSRPSRPARSARTRSPEKQAAADLRAAERARRRAERVELRRFTRRTRRRKAAWITAAGVVVAMAALLLVAVYSPLLALRTITIDGTSRLDPAELQAAVDDQLGTPLALLDEDRMTRDLSGFSLIRSYSTEVVPPSTLLIHIVERVPVASVEGPDGFDLVDPAGVVVETTAERPTGVPLIELAASDDRSSPAFESMTEVILALPAPIAAQVDSISARTRDDVTLTLVGGSQTVVWGSARDSVEKAQALGALLAANQSRAGIYDVSAPSSVVFRAG